MRRELWTDHTRLACLFSESMFFQKDTVRYMFILLLFLACWIFLCNAFDDSFTFGVLLLTWVIQVHVEPISYTWNPFYANIFSYLLSWSHMFLQFCIDAQILSFHMIKFRLKLGILNFACYMCFVYKIWTLCFICDIHKCTKESFFVYSLMSSSRSVLCIHFFLYALV